MLTADDVSNLIEKARAAEFLGSVGCGTVVDVIGQGLTLCTVYGVGVAASLYDVPPKVISVFTTAYSVLTL